jgi:hypothetical protein
MAGGITAIVLALVVAWVLFVPAADWLAHHDVGSARGALLQTARDAARGRLLTFGAGLFAAGALIFTARNFTLSREAQVTDRYTKAIEQLGSDKLDVRIGGIYALERIAHDSTRDHPVVMEVLTAFVREHSREPWPPPARPGLARITRRGPFRAGGPLRLMRIRPDVQAAVAVVGRRDAQRDVEPVNLFGVNLANALLLYANLRGALLSDADLRIAVLDGARLDKAILSDSDLTEASLGTAFLYRANLSGADLTEANLGYANLTNAFLHHANLSGADLTGADLTNADLTNADLSGANLTDVDLDGADFDGAKWPKDAPVPDGWKRDADTGRLQRADTDSGQAAADRGL